VGNAFLKFAGRLNSSLPYLPRSLRSLRVLVRSGRHIVTTRGFGLESWHWASPFFVLDLFSHYFEMPTSSLVALYPIIAKCSGVWARMLFYPPSHSASRFRVLAIDISLTEMASIGTLARNGEWLAPWHTATVLEAFLLQKTLSHGESPPPPPVPLLRYFQIVGWPAIKHSSVAGSTLIRTVFPRHRTMFSPMLLGCALVFVFITLAEAHMGVWVFLSPLSSKVKSDACVAAIIHLFMVSRPKPSFPLFQL
jgi:hypothetical protein